MATVTDAKGNKTTFEYDGFDRLAKIRYPHPTTVGTSSTTDFEQFTYDANGNMLTWRRRDGQTIASTYDNLDRLTVQDLPGGTALDVYLSYDLLGQVTAVRHGGPSSSNATLYTYDKAGRATSVTAGGRTVAYQYDAAGRRTRITWPDGFFVQYDYDMLGRVIPDQVGDRLRSGRTACHRVSACWRR